MVEPARPRTWWSMPVADEDVAANWAVYSRTHRRIHVVAQRDGFSCAYCGDPVGCDCYGCAFRTLATIDHVIAVINGGPDTFDNVVLACRSCNSSKGSAPADVMFPILTGAGA